VLPIPKKLRLAVVALAVLLGVCLVWLKRESGPAGDVVPPELSSPDPSTGSTPSGVESPDSGRASSPRMAATDSSADAGATQAAVDSKAPATIEVTGTVVVVDASGGEHASESGSFAAYPESPDSRVIQRVEVHEGRWSATVPSGLDLLVGKFELGGRTALLATPQSVFSVPASRVLELRVRWPAGTILHVKAEDTGLELDQVEIVRGRKLTYARGSHPGAYEDRDVAVKTGRSPIQLALEEKLALEGTALYFARSADYAWGHINLDLSRGGEFELLLKRAGSLDVRLSGPHLSDQAVLTIQNAENTSTEPDARLPIHGRDAISIDSLPVGHYEVSVEVEDLSSLDLPIGSAETDVVAGRNTQVDLTWELYSSPTRAKLTLAGVIVMPPEWGYTEFMLSGSGGGLEIKGVSSLDMRTGERPHEYAFMLNSIEEGVYDMVVDPPGWSQRVEVRPQGLKDVRIEVPSPAQVSVQVVEAGTTHPVNAEYIEWWGVDQEGRVRGHAQSSERDHTTNKFEFQAPEGTVRVQVAHHDYRRTTKSVSVRPGRNELSIEVERACGFTLALKNGDVLVPFDEGKVQVRQIDGPGRWEEIEGRPSAKRYTVTAPGRYRIEFPTLGGYRPIPSREIQIEPGAFAELVIQVERSS